MGHRWGISSGSSSAVARDESGMRPCSPTAGSLSKARQWDGAAVLLEGTGVSVVAPPVVAGAATRAAALPIADMGCGGEEGGLARWI